jgi:hypothetical protein
MKAVCSPFTFVTYCRFSLLCRAWLLSPFSVAGSNQGQTDNTFTHVHARRHAGLRVRGPSRLPEMSLVWQRFRRARTAHPALSSYGPATRLTDCILHPSAESSDPRFARESRKCPNPFRTLPPLCGADRGLKQTDRCDKRTREFKISFVHTPGIDIQPLLAHHRDLP